MSELLKPAELARRLGVPRAYITRMANRGTLEYDADGRIDLDKAIEALKNDPGFGSHAPHKEKPVTSTMEEITKPNAGESYFTARAIREKFAALRERTKHETEIAALIDREGAARALTTILAALTQSLDKVPDRASAELPDEFHHETRLAIRREIDRALGDCRRKLDKLLPEASA